MVFEQLNAGPTTLIQEVTPKDEPTPIQLVQVIRHVSSVDPNRNLGGRPSSRAASAQSMKRRRQHLHNQQSRSV